ncbi:ORF71R [Large yellow croaker iridovirus]|uniref:Uncharacterized protein n=2 Tax=Infectious spleen and kidney necrosis virus TaxID=180170 RepID=A0A7T3V8A3_ISKNV|nr:ORF71R [Turbot reddish body iridovirus]QQA04071.1 hypothetical protein Geno-4000076 [Large yellow croaker iridovirus]UZN72061.1 ORF71R [Large yellow croaker iridovirus]UZN72153.1 ORF71R [Large yellow croaker iridovirus]UZN72262.1 ORF71R [Large yellow croaker iridovirus]
MISQLRMHTFTPTFSEENLPVDGDTFATVMLEPPDHSTVNMGPFFTTDHLLLCYTLVLETSDVNTKHNMVVMASENGLSKTHHIAPAVVHDKVSLFSGFHMMRVAKDQESMYKVNIFITSTARGTLKMLGGNVTMVLSRLHESTKRTTKAELIA